MHFTLVTGNRNKLKEAERILGFAPDAHQLDLPEIQSLDLLTVLREKGQEAWRRLERPVAVEETGLELAALNGFPGPLVKWMLKAVGAAGLARAGHTLGDPRATAHTAILLLDGKRSIIAEGRTEGRLAPEPRGEHGFGWDGVFIPNGYEETYAELSPGVKDQIGHRGQAWRRLLKELRGPRPGQTCPKG